MAGERRRYPLPAGVVPAEPQAGGEASDSRVRTKAAVPADQHTRSQPVLKESLVELARGLVEELVTLGPNEIAPVVRRLMALGNFALEELAKSFPGPLWRRPVATDSRLPRPEEISAIAAALAAFEVEAIPYLARLMRHPTPTVRYHAAVICGAYSSPRLIEPLMQASLDEDRECRRVALHLLSSYQHEALYRNALGELRRCASEVSQLLPVRRRAISALTQLRDEASASLFVDLLAETPIAALRPPAVWGSGCSPPTISGFLENLGSVGSRSEVRKSASSGSSKASETAEPTFVCSHHGSSRV